MSQLALNLLGPPRVEIDVHEIRISRRKSLALLAYLAVTNQSHTRDALATLLWPGQDQSRARNSLRGALVSLRKALGEGWLEADRESVGLIHHPEPGRHPELGYHPELVEGADPSAGFTESPALHPQRGASDPEHRERTGQGLWLDVAEFRQHLAEWQARGRVRDLDATVAELLDELGKTGTDSLDQPPGTS